MPRPHFPDWLATVSGGMLGLGLLCAVLIAIDVARRPQKVWIMNLVWPVTALFGSVLWAWGYFEWGRAPTRDEQARNVKSAKPPFPVQVAKGATHCGAGCTLGDIVAEWLVFAIPAIAVGLGWKSVFGQETFAVWILDYLVAFAFGVVFQYFTLKPMRGLSVREGVLQALKADAASITAWQVGMYGLMALVQFAWFRPAYGAIAPVNSTEFWFAMQISMLAGFCTAYPVNWLLIRKGVKEAM